MEKTMTAKHFLSIHDVSKEDIESIFTEAEALKANPAKYPTAFKGKKWGLIFEKPSTRTRVSFDVGLFSLGGDSIYLRPDERLGVREEVRDVARTLGRYLAGAVLRTHSHQTIVEFSRYFKGPVINGLSDLEHPCQAMSDYFTIRERFQNWTEPTLAYVGDGNNVLNSLLLLAAKLGAKLCYATPKNHTPEPEILKSALEIAQSTGAMIEGTSDPVKAVTHADIIYTDVWVSMGQEKSRDKKLKDFKGMQVNQELMAHAKPNAYIMHCLPAHRGEEITEDTIESKNSIVFDQAENRLHVQKAILLHLCHTT